MFSTDSLSYLFMNLIKMCVKSWICIYLVLHTFYGRMTRFCLIFITGLSYKAKCDVITCTAHFCLIMYDAIWTSHQNVGTWFIARTLVSAWLFFVLLCVIVWFVFCMTVIFGLYNCVWFMFYVNMSDSCFVWLCLIFGLYNCLIPVLYDCVWFVFCVIVSDSCSVWSCLILVLCDSVWFVFCLILVLYDHVWFLFYVIMSDSCSVDHVWFLFCMIMSDSCSMWSCLIRVLCDYVWFVFCVVLSDSSLTRLPGYIVLIYVVLWWTSTFIRKHFIACLGPVYFINDVWLHHSISQYT